MMRSKFDEQLDRLNKEMMKMGSAIEDSIRKAVDALVKQDAELAKKEMIQDEEIDREQKTIESICFNLLIQQQPVAKDLRIVSSVLKVVTDIERVGDHVCDMAELIMRIHMNPFSGYSLHLDGMVTATKEMFMEAVSAFVEDNPSRSQKVIEGDDVIDMLFNKVKNDIIDGLKAELKNADEYIDILMIAKYLEKIGDHAVNVAEWQIFRKTGELS